MALRQEQTWHTEGAGEAMWLRAIRRVAGEEGWSHMQSLVHCGEKSEMYQKFCGSFWRGKSRKTVGWACP